MQFFFERLAERHTNSFGLEKPFQIESAVRAQIQRIVSCRPIDPTSLQFDLLEFGMPSIVEIAQGNKEQLNQYATRLKVLIGLYEPRLKNVQVELAQTTNQISPYDLQVIGVLIHDGEPRPFHFQLDSSH